MAHKIFVDGREGTTGLQIIDYLSSRNDIELLEIDPALRKDIHARKALINQSEVAFLCLPDAASTESAALVENPHTCIIDASTAFRTHPDWVYGLPELAPKQRNEKGVLVYWRWDRLPYRVARGAGCDRCP